MAWRIRMCGIPLLLFLVGCAAYHSMPLTQETLEQALVPPTGEVLHVQAKSLHHPILPAIDFDERDGLSPEEAAVLAVLANPGLRAIRDQRAIAQGQVLQAGLLPNPRLGYFMSFPTGQVDPGTVTEFGGWLTWDLRTVITRAARVDVAVAHAESVDLDVAWQEWQVAQAAKLSAYRLWTFQAQAVLAQELGHLLEKNVHQLRRALNQGLITALELSAAETANNSAHANVLKFEKLARQERVMLNRLLGFPSERRIPLQKDINAPNRLTLPSLDDLLQDLEERRLDLVALRHGYESQDARVRGAILGQFNNIQIGFLDVRDTGNYYRPGFQVWTDIPIFNRNQGTIASARATRQKLFDEYVSRDFQARNDIATLLVGLEWLNEQVANAQEAIPILTRLVDKLRSALSRGQSTVVLYYTALGNLTTKHIQILGFRQQLVEATIALELATGLYRLDSPTTATMISKVTDRGGSS